MNTSPAPSAPPPVTLESVLGPDLLARCRALDTTALAQAFRVVVAAHIKAPPSQDRFYKQMHEALDEFDVALREQRSREHEERMRNRKRRAA